MSTNNILVGILRCDRPVAEAWSARLNELTAPDGYVVHRRQIFSPGQSKFEEIEKARNELADEASGYQYLLFLDDDVVPPVDALVKLVGAFDDRTRIVGGLCPRRHISGQKQNFLVWRGAYDENADQYVTEWSPDEAFEVSGLGTGCMLIDTRIFAEMKKPYFVSDYAVRPNNRVVDGFTTTRVGEDAVFCRRVEKLGYKILAHAGVLCEHLNPPTRERLDEYLLSQW